MGDAFEKPKQHVKRPGEVGIMRGIADLIRERGHAYADDVRASLPKRQQLMRDYAGYLRPIAADMTALGMKRLPGSDIEPIVGELLKTARDPIDDELTDYFFKRYQNSTRDRLAARGLIGQGVGEGIESDAERDFFMSARDQADARRVAAASGAQALRAGNTNEALSLLTTGTGYRGAELGAEQGVFDEISNVAGQEFDLLMASLPVLDRIMAFEGQKRMLEANLRAASIPLAEQLIGNTVTGVSMFMGGGGKGGGGGGGGGGGNFKSQTSAVPFNYTPYGGDGDARYAQQGGMTPWGTPAPTPAPYYAPPTPAPAPNSGAYDSLAREFGGGGRTPYYARAGTLVYG